MILLLFSQEYAPSLTSSMASIDASVTRMREASIEARSPVCVDPDWSLYSLLMFPLAFSRGSFFNPVIGFKKYVFQNVDLNLWPKRLIWKVSTLQIRILHGQLYV